jgi:hypothetical protein
MAERPNNHHILYTRKLWESHQSTRDLRRNKVLIPTIEPVIHALIHNEVAIVPVLDHNTAPRVERDFIPVGGDTVRSVERLMWVIDKQRMHHKAGELERSMGELTILALEMQLPYLTPLKRFLQVGWARLRWC